MTFLSDKENMLLRLLSSLAYGTLFIYVIITKNLIPFYIFMVTLIIGSIHELITINKKTKYLIFIGTTAYVLISFILFIKIKNSNNGVPLILILMIQVWSADLGGYLIGKLFGKNKLTIISPNKTWEGICGSLIFCLSSGFLCNKLNPNLIQSNWILVSTSICFGSIVGDLIISKMKRVNNIKDSGYFLPGHGGFLDRLDSLFLSTIIYYFIIYI